MIDAKRRKDAERTKNLERREKKILGRLNI